MHLDMTDQGSWLCLNWIFGEDEKRISQWKCDKHHSFLCSWTCLHESYLGIKKKQGKLSLLAFYRREDVPLRSTEVRLTFSALKNSIWEQINLCMPIFSWVREKGKWKHVKKTTVQHQGEWRRRGQSPEERRGDALVWELKTFYKLRWECNTPDYFPEIHKEHEGMQHSIHSSEGNWRIWMLKEAVIWLEQREREPWLPEIEENLCFYSRTAHP